MKFRLVFTWLMIIFCNGLAFYNRFLSIFTKKWPFWQIQQKKTNFKCKKFKKANFTFTLTLKLIFYEIFYWQTNFFIARIDNDFFKFKNKPLKNFKILSVKKLYYNWIFETSVLFSFNISLLHNFTHWRHFPIDFLIEIWRKNSPIDLQPNKILISPSNWPFSVQITNSHIFLSSTLHKCSKNNTREDYWHPI